MTIGLKKLLWHMISITMLISSVAAFSACSADEIDDADSGNETGKEDTNPDEPNDKPKNLNFVKNSDDTFGFEIRDDNGSIYASQPNPVIIRTKNNNGKEELTKSGYQEITATANGNICSATITTTSGSKFVVTDTYTILNNTLFRVKRSVKVNKAVTNDKGFSSQFSIISNASGSSLKSFNLFAPGFLYRNNTYNNPYENNPNLSSGSFDFRETRYGLPMFMAHSATAKKTISLSHVNPSIKSDIDEKNSKQWVTSSSVEYGSLGASIDKSRISINYCYPSIETETPRSHPVKAGQSHSYTLAIAISNDIDYTAAAVKAYKQHFALNNIKLYDVDIKEAYNAQMDMFSALAAPITGKSGNRAYGLPWSISIPDGKPQAFELQNGFVGQQTSIAFQLMRHGKLSGNNGVFNQGLEMAKFWFSDKQLVDYGLPRSWWIQNEKQDGYGNKYIGDFWTYPSFTRCFTDGMEGLLDCVRFAEAYKLPQAEEWGKIIKKFGDFLLNAETAGDGSFYRAYQKDGKYLRDVNAIGPWPDEQKKIQASSKTNTLIPVRLLIRLYEWSGDKRYLDRAIQAGEYGYNEFYKKLGTFIGGTPDNANVVDKEAGVFAMYAFTALYQATGDKKWLEAAEYAAVYAFSYTYCYDFAIQGNDVANIFRDGGISGYSFITAGAGGTDNYNAFIYYELFKLYILTGDKFYANAAKVLERNTKSPMDLDGTKGYAHKALLLEATTLYKMTFSSVSTWLPWCGVATSQPMVNFYQTFGRYNISDIENKSLESLKNEIEKVGAGGKKYVIK